MQSLTYTLAAEEEKLLACIHCGLCLEACPTYVATGDENDGPRGRLYLMRAVGEGRLNRDSRAFESHIDRCLGCRACESVCPAGVEYGQLLEASRHLLFSSPENRGSVYRLLRVALRHVWLQPRRLRFGFLLARLLRDSGLASLISKSGLGKRISPRFEFSLALLESSASPGTRSWIAQKHRSDRAENQVLLFTGCVTEGLFSRVNNATARVLQANGYQVTAAAGQVCCGALHAHAGDLEGARKLARKNIAAFGVDGSPAVITNAGGCGAMLASYGHLLADEKPIAEHARRFSERVRDISQQLAQKEMKPGAPLPGRVVSYDASCHLIYGQKAGDAPVEMLRCIPELKFVPLAGAERCCGGAGIYNLLERDLSERVLAEKISAIKETGATTLATGNAGCHMQIGAGARLAGLKLEVCHPVELLDESYRNAGLYEE